MTVLLLTFYGHITVDHISCQMRRSRAKLIGYLWVAQDLELVYMLVVMLLFFSTSFNFVFCWCFFVYIFFILKANVAQYVIIYNQALLRLVKKYCKMLDALFFVHSNCQFTRSRTLTVILFGIHRI